MLALLGCRAAAAGTRAHGRGYHHSPVLVRVAEHFGIKRPEGFYALNRAAVLRAFPRDKQVLRPHPTGR